MPESNIDESVGCIYLITCLIVEDGWVKRYVGKSIHPDETIRFKEHTNLRRGTNTLLKNAMRKHGIKNFKVERLCLAPINNLNNLEEYYAEQYETYMWDTPGGYNMVWCGANGNLGIPHTKETIDKLSSIQQNRSKETCEKISKALKGRQLSEDQKNKIKEALNNPEIRNKIGSANRGKAMSEEQKHKISETSKQLWTPELRNKVSIQRKLECRKMSEEAKQKLSDSKKGIPRSEETKKKLSEANIGKKASEESKLKMAEAARINHTGKKRSDESKKRMSDAKKNKPLTESQKEALAKAKIDRFDKLFNSHLQNWLSNNDSEKQWMYDMTRKRKDGNLLEKYILILDNLPNWRWSSNFIVPI